MEKLNRDGVKTILMPFGWKAVFFICFFLAAGRLNIPRAWLFLGIDFLGVIVVSVIFWKLTPGLANQRAAIREGTKAWDKIFPGVLFFRLADRISDCCRSGRGEISVVGVSYQLRDSRRSPLCSMCHPRLVGDSR